MVCHCGLRDDFFLKHDLRHVGIKEIVAKLTGQRRAFHDIEELWAMLAETGSPVSGSKRKPAGIEK